MSSHWFAQSAQRWYGTRFSIAEEDDYDEGTQLVRPVFQPKWYEKLSIALLILILVTGVGISIYLMVVSSGPDYPKFVLVARDNWTNEPRCGDSIPALPLPVQKILLLSTNSPSCRDELDCTDKINQLRKEQVEKLQEEDVVYNFIMAGDERIYEGRGLFCQSTYENQSTAVLTIAFLRRYEDARPTTVQARILEAFLEHLIDRQDLSTCYIIMVQDSPLNYLTDLADELTQRRKKNIC